MKVKLFLLYVFLLPMFFLAGKTGDEDFSLKLQHLIKSGIKLKKSYLPFLMKSDLSREEKGLLLGAMVVELQKIDPKTADFLTSNLWEEIKSFWNEYKVYLSYAFPVEKKEQIEKLFGNFQIKAEEILGDKRIETLTGEEWVDALSQKAQKLYEAGKYSDAILDYSKILKIFPKDYPARLGRALAFRESGEWDKAIQDLESLIKLYPEKEDPYIYLAEIYWKLKLEKEAQKCIESGLKVSPKNKNLLALKGYYLYLEGKYGEAMVVYRKLLSFYPYNRDGLMGMALCFMGIEDYEQAITHLERVLNIYPGDREALLYEINIYKVERKWKEALKVVDLLLSYDPENKDALKEKGEILLQLGNLEEARKIFRLLLHQDKTDLDALLSLAEISKLRKDYPKARYYLEEANKYHSLHPLPLIKLGRLEVEEGHYAKGMMQIQRGLQLEPQNEEGLLGLAEAYYGMGKINKAANILKKLFKQSPNYYPAYSLMAMVEELAGYYEEAIKYYKLLEEDWAYLRIARIYEEKQCYKQAIYYYKLYLSYHPEDKNVLDKISLLRKYQHVGVEGNYFNQAPLEEILTENTGRRGYNFIFDIYLSDKWKIRPYYGFNLIKEADIEHVSDNNFGLEWSYRYNLNTLFAGYTKIHSFSKRYNGETTVGDFGLTYNYQLGAFSFRASYDDKVLDDDIISIYAGYRKATLKTDLTYWATNYFAVSFAPSYTKYNDDIENYNVAYDFNIFYLIPSFPSFSINYSYFYQLFGSEMDSLGDPTLYFAPDSYRRHTFSLNYHHKFWERYTLNSTFGWSRYSYTRLGEDYLFNIYAIDNRIEYSFNDLYKFYAGLNFNIPDDGSSSSDIYSGFSYRF